MVMIVVVVMMVMVQSHCILGWGRPHPKVLPRTKMAIMAMMVMVIQSSVFSRAFTSYASHTHSLPFRTAPDDYCLTERKCQIFIRQIVRRVLTFSPCFFSGESKPLSTMFFLTPSFFRGVQFIHSQRILHLDLKPFNIMFANPDDDYNLRIIDFGLAERFSASHITVIMTDMITIPRLSDKDDQVMMSMCGTLEYMSPEVMDCRHASPASDMW